jgi:O-antigen ligase
VIGVQCRPQTRAPVDRAASSDPATIRATGQSWFVTLWLLGSLVAPLVAADDDTLARGLAVVWLAPILALRHGWRFLVGPVFRSDRKTVGAAVTFLVLTLPGAILSVDPVTAVQYWVGTIAAFLVAAGMWELGERNIEAGTARYAVVGTLLTAVALIGVRPDDGRFGSPIAPNPLGLLLFGILACSLMVRHRAVWMGIWLVCGTALLATGSRAAMLATIATLLTTWVVKPRRFSPRRIAGLAALVIALSVLLYAAGTPLYEAGVRLFAVYDPWRDPIETGFTGRIYVWQETLRIWLEHPFWGVGYRSLEHHLTEASSAHNGYLSVLAEIGIMGALPLAVFMTLRTRGLWSRVRARDRLGTAGLALVAGMAVESLFERYLINFGNPTSLLFLLVLLTPTRVDGATPRETGQLA